MSVFDENFNMKEYLAKRLLEIEDLPNRRIYKELVGKIFYDLHHDIESEYKDLEKRVFDEISMPIEGSELITSIVSKKMYDVTDQFLFPMRPEDLNPLQVDSELLLEAVQRQGAFYLYTVFLQADYLEACRFYQPDRIFGGCIRTEHSEFTARFSVRPNDRYRNKIAELYEIFQVNYLPWRSVCAPYIFKLFDVYIISIENWDAKETIIEARVDFEEYNAQVQYDQIPLWNISIVSIKTSTCPEPCIDKINYEHRLFKQKFKPDAKYLVANREAGILNIRWLRGDLMITCPAPDPLQWDLYQFHIPVNRLYPNPDMGNGIKSTFAAKVRGWFEPRIKTKQEIARLLSSFAAAEKLEFIKARLLPNPVEKETYCVDFFIADELRCGKWETALVLEFRPKDPENYLNRDLMSFLVGIVQHYFPEYECCGRLL